MNSESEIESATKEAFSSSSARDAVKRLCQLKGVAVPRASAILSWTFPARFGVIDQRAWRTLKEYRLTGGSRPEGVNLGLAQWEHYHDVLQKLAVLTNKTPQEIDLWLYNRDKDRSQSAGGTKKRRSMC